MSAFFSLSTTLAFPFSLSLPHPQFFLSFYSLPPSPRSYERNAPDIARLKVLSGEMLEHNRMMAKHQSSFEENNELVQTASKRAAVASESLQTELRKHDRKSKKKTAAATALFARF